MFELIMECLITSKPIDYSVICSWSATSAEHDRALSQCDYYGVVVANRPSHRDFPQLMRKEDNELQN